MPVKDYGQFLQRMRNSRGFTQEQVVKASGVSITTVKNLESSGERISIRASSLDAILTALAMRGYIGPSEIKVLCEATDRMWESFEELNFRAEELKNKSSSDLRTRPKKADPTLEERFVAAFRVLIDTDQAEAALTMIEALADQVGNQLADEHRTPKKTSKRSPRVLKVTGEIEKGPLPGTIQQVTTDFVIADDKSQTTSEQPSVPPDTLPKSKTP